MTHQGARMLYPDCRGEYTSRLEAHTLHTRKLTFTSLAKFLVLFVSADYNTHYIAGGFISNRAYELITN